jgi:hypothetical protein
MIPQASALTSAKRRTMKYVQSHSGLLSTHRSTTPDVGCGYATDAPLGTEALNEGITCINSGATTE